MLCLTTRGLVERIGCAVDFAVLRMLDFVAHMTDCLVHHTPVCRELALQCCLTACMAGHVRNEKHTGPPIPPVSASGPLL